MLVFGGKDNQSVKKLVDCMGKETRQHLEMRVVCVDYGLRRPGYAEVRESDNS